MPSVVIADDVPGPFATPTPRKLHRARTVPSVSATSPSGDDPGDEERAAPSLLRSKTAPAIDMELGDSYPLDLIVKNTFLTLVDHTPDTPSLRRARSAQPAPRATDDNVVRGHCDCGNAYLPDEVFCRRCGVKRREAEQNSKSSPGLALAWPTLIAGQIQEMPKEKLDFQQHSSAVVPAAVMSIAVHVGEHDDAWKPVATQPSTGWQLTGTCPQPSWPKVPPPMQMQHASAFEEQAAYARDHRDRVSLDLSTMLRSPLAQPQLGSAEFPTVGSAGHNEGQCKPCAFKWKPAGCTNGAQCPFCHLCDAGEKKRRQKEKKAMLKSLGASSNVVGEPQGEAIVPGVN